jgi:hypothetical protein
MTLGVRHDVSADAIPSPATEAEEAAMDLNLSDSFEVPPGADAAAASVVSEGLTTHERLFPEEAEEAPTEEAPTTEPTPAPSSDAFSEPGTDTVNMLAKMKDDTKYDVSVSDPAATAGGDTATGSLPISAFRDPHPLAHGAHGAHGPLSSAFKSMPATTPSVVGSGPVSASPYSSEGTVTPCKPDARVGRRIGRGRFHARTRHASDDGEAQGAQARRRRTGQRASHDRTP